MRSGTPAASSNRVQRRATRSPRGLAASLGGALALLLIAAACDRSEGDEDQPALSGAAKRREPTRVLVEPAQRREMTSVLETSTKVESESQVEVFPRSNGLLMELFVEEGDRVVAGQPLARIDDRDARVAVEEAKVALAEAEADAPRLTLAIGEATALQDGSQLRYDQAIKDHERNRAIFQVESDAPALITEKDFQASLLAMNTARADLESAKLAVQRAQLDEKAGVNAVDRAKLSLARAQHQLDDTTIRAPFDGVVAERRINVGDNVTSAAASFVVTDPGRLRAVFYRPQRELPLFVPAAGNGDHNSAEVAITAVAEAIPGVVFPGTIQRVSPTIQADSGNFRVTASLESRADGPTGGRRLLPGMLVRLRVVTDRRSGVLAVNKRAVMREGDQSLVYVARDGVAERVLVEEGLSDSDHVELLPIGSAQLSEGDLVIVVGNRDLEDGAEVAVENAPTDPDARGLAPAGPAEPDAEGEEPAAVEAVEERGDDEPQSGDE